MGSPVGAGGRQSVLAAPGRHVRAETGRSKKPWEALVLQLIFGGRILTGEDEELTLGQLGMADGAVLHCFVTAKVEEQQLWCYPHSCSTDGGRVVRVLGASFPVTSRTACRFGTVLVDAKLEDDGSEGGVSQLVCTAPPHPAGPVTISVSFDGGATWMGGPSFWYWDPSVANCAIGVAVPSSCHGMVGVRADASFGSQVMRWDREDRDPDAGCA